MKLMAEPSAIKPKRIQNVRDRSLYSLRINRDYRVILSCPKGSDEKILLWAGKRDKAYDWAKRQDIKVHPVLGTVQVYEPQDPMPSSRPGSLASDLPGLYDDLKNRELLRMAVPPAMLGEVRDICSKNDLEELKDRLPEDAYSSLQYYLIGLSYDEIILDLESPKEVDTEDFSKALGRQGSRAHFGVINNEKELKEILKAPLEQWRVFLHPSQRNLVERHWNGPVRVLGGSGTGKTVAAIHRARWLAHNLSEPGRILFLTYARNLATDIENNLKSICEAKELSRIEVASLDEWVTEFLGRFRYEFQMAREPDEYAWRTALDRKRPRLTFPEAFYTDEWEQVVLACGVTTKAEYLQVSRRGRGTGLNRADRAKVWPVFEEYRRQLAKRQLKAPKDIYRDATLAMAKYCSASEYLAVIVDEAQDFGTQAFRLIRSIVPEGRDDLFIVGDGHQRIHGRDIVVLGRCGINIRGRSRKLRFGYRTTEQTRRWAIRLLEGREIDDLNGGLDDNERFVSLTRGPEPRLVGFVSREEQVNYIAGYLNDVRDNGELLREVCVVVRTRNERDSVKKCLEDHDIDVLTLEGASPDVGADDMVRIMTMHRVKGLEFDRVVIASANNGIVPWPEALDSGADEVATDQAETRERALVYVAATRAKKELLVLCYGEPSRLFAWNAGETGFI